MPKTDGDELGPEFEWRLRAALDRVQPLHSAPRYQEPLPAPRRWAAAPAVFAAGVAAILVLTLLAAAASTRSLDLQHRIVNTIQPATEPSPTAPSEQSPSPTPVQAQPAPPTHEASTPEATEPAVSSPHGETGDGSSGESSPQPSDEPSSSPSPSATSSDH